MSDKENKNAPEELPDEVLDEVAGGVIDDVKNAPQGVLHCRCGVVLHVLGEDDVVCQCGRHWHHYANSFWVTESN